jgi:hypothetical protein
LFPQWTLSLEMTSDGLAKNVGMVPLLNTLGANLLLLTEGFPAAYDLGRLTQAETLPHLMVSLHESLLFSRF